MRLIKHLPDPFLMQDGRRVISVEDWQKRREEIKDMMLNIQYGTMPGPPEKVSVTIIESQTQVNGETCEKLRFDFTAKEDRPDLAFGMDVTVWHPSTDSIVQRKNTVKGFAQNGIPVLIYVGNRQFEQLLAKGYTVICYENNQLEPMEMGHAIVGPARTAYQQLAPDRYSWGSISTWAWGGLRLVDYAGSGCAGAGSYLALGEKCEDLAALTSRERWWAWAHADFEQWAGGEEELPFDQHFLMGLVAPRPLLRTEGTTDAWANPAGTCASFLATEPIYDFLGVPERNGIFFHEGGHDHTEEDIAVLADFADTYFFGVPLEGRFKSLPQDQAERPAAFDWARPS